MGFLKKLLGGSDRPPQSAGSAESGSTDRDTPPPKHAEALYRKGTELYEEAQTEGDVQKAREVLVMLFKATQADPEHLESHVLLAQMFFSLQEIDMAMKYAERAYKLAPTDKRAMNIASVCHFEKGKTLWDENEWRDAFSYFKRSLEIDPDHATMPLEAFAAMATLSRPANCLTEFAGVCRWLLERNDRDDGKRYALGIADLEMYEDQAYWSNEAERREILEEARTCIEEYAARHPSTADGCFALCKLYTLQGDAASAKRQHEQLRRLDEGKANRITEWSDGLRKV